MRFQSCATMLPLLQCTTCYGSEPRRVWYQSILPGRRSSSTSFTGSVSKENVLFKVSVLSFCHTAKIHFSHNTQPDRLIYFVDDWDACSVRSQCIRSILRQTHILKASILLLSPTFKVRVSVTYNKTKQISNRVSLFSLPCLLEDHFIPCDVSQSGQYNLPRAIRRHIFAEESPLASRIQNCRLIQLGL